MVDKLSDNIIEFSKFVSKILLGIGAGLISSILVLDTLHPEEINQKKRIIFLVVFIILIYGSYYLENRNYRLRENIRDTKR